MASRGRAADSQVISFDSNEGGRSTSSAGSSRPNTPGGRSKKPKLSEFRQQSTTQERPEHPGEGCGAPRSAGSAAVGGVRRCRIFPRGSLSFASAVMQHPTRQTLGTGDSATKELVTEALETMEAYGKDDAHLMIQQYVPAFQSCCGA
ncbi:hypothetical protein GQ600_21228 [Phytophthora cactorum]|nr:hypothetical protein GQ600_21228 [Phytophthora cactorum]